MKISCSSNLAGAGTAKARQGGMALIAVLAMLALVMIYVAANMRSLANLERELKMIEQKQIRRLAATPPAENAPAVSTLQTELIPPAPEQ